MPEFDKGYPEGKVCLKSPGKDPKASSAHPPGRSVPGLMRQTLQGFEGEIFRF